VQTRTVLIIWAAVITAVCGTVAGCCIVPAVMTPKDVRERRAEERAQERAKAKEEAAKFAAAKAAGEHPAARWPYHYVKSKSEPAGKLSNVMDLYAYAGALDVEDLRSFCLKRRADNSASAFYFVVIFDRPENAKFPDNPLAAGFADLNTLKHIRAIYTYNRVNGFSELRRGETDLAGEGVVYEKL
jgi:hypothetical protein